MMLALLSAPTLAADTPADLYSGYALNNARLIGLSPAGAKLWAEHILQAGDWQKWRGQAEAHARFTRQLALEQVDWALLEQLAGESSSEEARAFRVRRQGSVDKALQLTAGDRKAIGAFLLSGSQRRSEAIAPTPELTRAALGSVLGSTGLSGQGMDALVEASREGATDARAETDFEKEIGEQLSKERPDPRILKELVTRFAAAEGERALASQKRLIRVARRLTPDDRQRLGRALADIATEELDSTKPVLDFVP